MQIASEIERILADDGRTGTRRLVAQLVELFEGYGAKAEGLKLGSRLTVEGVEAVVVPVVDLQPIADVANNYDGMFVEPDVPILAVGTARFRLNNARSIRAMLSAAGDGR